MDQRTTMGFLDLIVVGAALYILYAWFMLTYKSKITTGLLVSKTCNVKKCKDLDAYKKEIGWKTLLTGLTSLASGCLGLYQDYVAMLPQAIYWFFFILFFVILIWFGLQAKKAEEKFFS